MFFHYLLYADLPLSLRIFPKEASWTQYNRVRRIALPHSYEILIMKKGYKMSDLVQPLVFIFLTMLCFYFSMKQTKISFYEKKHWSRDNLRLTIGILQLAIVGFYVSLIVNIMIYYQLIDIKEMCGDLISLSCFIFLIIIFLVKIIKKIWLKSNKLLNSRGLKWIKK